MTGVSGRHFVFNFFRGFVVVIDIILVHVVVPFALDAYPPVETHDAATSSPPTVQPSRGRLANISR